MSFDTESLKDPISERAVLSCLAQNPLLMAEIMGALGATDFMNQHNRYIFKIFETLYRETGFSNEPVFDISSIQKS